jgi:hypothetical protein
VQSDGARFSAQGWRSFLVPSLALATQLGLHETPLLKSTTAQFAVALASTAMLRLGVHGFRRVGQ